MFGIDVDIDTYRSVDETDDGVWIRMLVGPDEGIGEESFDVLVCTPQWLTRMIDEDGMSFVRHTLLMSKLDLPRAAQRLKHEVPRSEAKDWPGLMLHLVQVDYWEFQDYHGNEAATS